MLRKCDASEHNTTAEILIEVIAKASNKLDAQPP